MTDATERPTIDSLLADRARYESWLEQLAAKAAQVPAHVVERVQADYRTRLADVVAALTDRAEELRGEAVALAERVTALDGELVARRDARAEDELRAMVGEYDAAVWEARAAEHDAAIAAVVAERDARAADRDRAVGLLDDATRPSQEAVVERAREIAAEPTPVEPMDAMPPAEAEPGVVALPREEAAPAEAFGIPAMRPSRKSPFDEIAFLDTIVGRPTPAPAPVPPVVREHASVVSMETVPDALLELPLPVEEPEAVGDVGEVRRATPEAIRTLKCQECGTFNYPTEWYCEKCGGELSAF